MKCIASSLALLLVAVSTLQTTQALKSYLSNIPNGASFTQELGHPNKDDSLFTDFAKAFQAVDLTWTTEFCKAYFPGSTTITNGEAFGDPCCTWKKGGTPDKTVTAFTTKPTAKTTCAAAAAPAATPAPAATTAKPAATLATEKPSSAPAATTTAPAAATPAAATPAAATPAAATTKPASGDSYAPGKVSPGKGKGCTIKGKKGKGSMRGSGKSSSGAKQTSRA